MVVLHFNLRLLYCSVTLCLLDIFLRGHNEGFLAQNLNAMKKNFLPGNSLLTIFGIENIIIQVVQ